MRIVGTRTKLVLIDCATHTYTHYSGRTAGLAVRSVKGEVVERHVIELLRTNPEIVQSQYCDNAPEAA